MHDHTARKAAAEARDRLAERGVSMAVASQALGRSERTLRRWAERHADPFDGLSPVALGRPPKRGTAADRDLVIAALGQLGPFTPIGSLQQLAIVTGIFVALLVDYLLADAAGGAMQPMPWGGAAWRWMFASAAVPAVIYAVLALQIPESPRYLVRRGRLAEARAVIKRLIGGDVEKRITDIKRTVAGTQEKVKLGVLKGPRLGLLPIVWVGILLSVFQQFVGINVIFYYSSTLWASVGFSESNSLLITVITSVTNIVTTLIAIALVDKIGRRPLLLIGAAGMVLTLGVMAWCFSTATQTVGPTGEALTTLSPAVGKVALVAANLYVVAFGMSWGPVVWVLLGEMFNNRIRATALAVAAAAQWIANWLISTTFPALASIGLTFAYGLYALFALLAFFFVLKSVRETKGRELESM